MTKETTRTGGTKITRRGVKKYRSTRKEIAKIISDMKFHETYKYRDLLHHDFNVRHLFTTVILEILCYENRINRFLHFTFVLKIFL